MNSGRGLRGLLLPLSALLTYAFLYIPIVVLIIFSFNKSLSGYEWGGFTLQWYRELFYMPELWIACRNTLIVACLSVVLSLLLGIWYVFGGYGTALASLGPLFFGSVALPEIVIAVGMLRLFSVLSVPLGLTTLVVGHTLLGLGFVIPIVRSQAEDIDPSLREASLDLGASELQTFVRVTLPLMSPALMAAGLLVFIVSLDDFLISFFCSGTSSQTLSLYIFSLIRLGISPLINALSTLLLVASSIIVLAFCLIQIRKRVL